jgi:2-amino-4-hydroxy-6-hydroxymethyldihydropteridine diphosphokinase
VSLAWIGLGANLGRPQRTLETALQALDLVPSARLLQVSPAYWTPPWGVLEQPDFLNAVACLQTDQSPSALLRILQDIELHLGRVRDKARWGPREIDLDLLLVDDRTEASEDLTLPHPRLHERAFVLVPLCDLAPGLEVPGHGMVSDLLEALPEEAMDGIRPAGRLAKY